MTDLEIVLMIAFAVMLYLYNRTSNALRYYKCAILAVGMKQATVTVNEEDKSFSIDIDYNGLKQHVSKN
jgi:hypothetical protein